MSAPQAVTPTARPGAGEGVQGGAHRGDRWPARPGADGGVQGVVRRGSVRAWLGRVVFLGERSTTRAAGVPS